jgi:hypothetical protein
MPPLALISPTAPCVAPTTPWFGAAPAPVAEFTKPTLMVPPPAPADAVELELPLELPPQPARTIAAPITTASAPIATAVHVRFLIVPPFLAWFLV